MENNDLAYMEPRPMRKKELAALYAPGLKPKSALNRLNAWLRYSPELMQELAAADYYATQKLLTARQVKIIFEYLGEP